MELKVSKFFCTTAPCSIVISSSNNADKPQQILRNYLFLFEQNKKIAEIIRLTRLVKLAAEADAAEADAAEADAAASSVSDSVVPTVMSTHNTDYVSADPIWTKIWNRLTKEEKENNSTQIQQILTDFSA